MFSLEPENEQNEFTIVNCSDSLVQSEKDAQHSGVVSGPAFSGASYVKLSILMPAYNEENRVIKAVAEILGTCYPCDIELIVVDDGSTDATASLLSQFHDSRMIVHRHPVNKGKGAALRSAASLATGTHLLPFDADLEYAAEDIPRLLEPVLRGRCDVVYGTRLFGCNTVYQSYRYALGNRLLTLLTNIFFNANISDLHTCLKLMPATVIREFSLNEIGFGLDTEVTALLLLRGIRPFEVPISYYSRSHAEGKKISWRDGIKCVWILLRMRLQGRRYRLPPRVGAPALERDGTVIGENDVPSPTRWPSASTDPSPGWDGPPDVPARLAGLDEHRAAGK